MTSLPVSRGKQRREKLSSQHLARHLEWCNQRNLRPTYIQTRRRTICQLARELDMTVEDATDSDLDRWYETVTGRMKAEARAVYLSHVQCYFRWCVREKLLEKDPTVRLVRPKTATGLPRPMDDRDLADAIERANDRVKPWLLLATYAGLRACEIAKVRSEDVDLRAQRLFVSEGKGGRQRNVPLHPEVAAVLEPLMRGRGYLFDHWERSGPPTAHNVSHGCNHHFRQLGLHATAHQMRHWFLTNVYRESKDIRLTQDLAGHSSPATTAVYTQVSADRAMAVVRALKVGG